MKKCACCDLQKSLSDFYKDRNAKDGYHSWCKACKISNRMKWAKDPYNKVKDKLSKKKWSDKNVDKINSQRAAIIQRDPDYFKIKRREYVQRHKDKLLKIGRARDKLKRDSHPLYKLRRATSNLLTRSIKSRYKKTSKTYEILGCDFDYLISYMESLFEPGMSWSNYGKNGWSIDHVCPCNQAQNEEELLKLQHFTNLKPIWHIENIKKKANKTPEALLKCKELLNREWI